MTPRCPSFMIVFTDHFPAWLKVKPALSAWYCVLLASLLVPLPVTGVDKGNFKTCDQSGFCKRNRALQPTDNSAFRVKPESISHQGGKVQFILLNALNSKQFKAELFSLEDNMVRITVDELNPVRERFKAADALVGEPKLQKFDIINKDAAATTLTTLDGHRVVLHYKPFRLDVYSHTDLVVSLNSQGLMNFEHFREKPAQPAGWLSSLWNRFSAPAAEPAPENHDEVEKQYDGGGSWWVKSWRPLCRFRDWVLDALSPSPSASTTSHGAADLNEDAVDMISDDGDDMPLRDYLQEDAANVESSEPPPVTEAPAPAAADAASREADGPGFWEETFKTHEDKKPHGSSSIGLDISFVGFDHVFGIPEHADSFSLRSTTGQEPYRLYNLDVFEYELKTTMALYASIPYMIAHSVSKTVGAFWLNPSEAWIDIKSSTADKGVLRSLVERFRPSHETPQVDTHWMFETGVIDVFIILGPRPYDVFRQYSKLTGVSELPPQFSIAYHQCRWNYNDMEDVKNVQEGFDEHDIPFDVLWLDIEHTDGKRYFTWDPHKFSDPKAMLQGLADRGRKMVTIVDPHIKKDDNYKVFKQARDNHYLVKNRDGGEYDGWCWPGSSGYLDFWNPEVMDYWAKHYSLEEYEGSTETLFIWNDMNEPSVFNGPEITMHKDAKHYGGWEHRDVHNMYGFYNHKATHKGLVERSQHKLRPFVLTRSMFAGSQRYAAIWTGDNMANWDHLQMSMPMMLSLSVAGIPFVGADVGGFFHNPEEELLVRWYQTGAFSPFYRAHAHLDTRRREPWLFSESAKKTIRDAIRLRYRFLPYWYTLFYEHTRTGLPVMRPCWAEFPESKYCVDEDKQFFVGSAILVKPVTAKDQKKISIYLPQDGSVWYELDTLAPHPGSGAVWLETPLTKIPAFFRGGYIVPTRERPRRASTLMNHDPFTLYVALNYEATYANGTLYEDDGKSYAYKSGQFLYRGFEYTGDKAHKGTLISKNLAPSSARYESDAWIERVVVLGMRFHPTKVTLSSGGGKVILQHKYEPKTMTLTVRKPGVNINKDWSLEIAV